MKSNVNIQKILKQLEKRYTAATALEYETPFQLLVATILSAQCTDKRVNQVTKELFNRFPTVNDIAGLSAEELEPWVQSCGLYRNKSKNIVATAGKILKEHHGQVPDNLEELIALPGVGRKTANVVISNAFGRPAIAVDTHVFRVANRLGMSNSTTPLGTEQDLRQVIPESQWSQAHHWLIYHGRQVCKARKPLCDICGLSDYCATFKGSY